MWIWYIFILVQRIGCQIICKHLEKFRTFKTKICCCNINSLDRLLILVIFLYHNPYHSLTFGWTFVYCPLPPCSSRVHLQAFVLFLEALGGSSTSTFCQQDLSNDVLIEPIHGDMGGRVVLKKSHAMKFASVRHATQEHAPHPQPVILFSWADRGNSLMIWPMSSNSEIFFKLLPIFKDPHIHLSFQNLQSLYLIWNITLASIVFHG